MIPADQMKIESETSAESAGSTSAKSSRHLDFTAPNRFSRPSPFGFVIVIAVLAFLIHGWSQGAALNAMDLIEGIGRIGNFLGEAFPPDVDRLGAILMSLLVTFEMALLGTLIGVVLSLPVAVAAARNTSPHHIVYAIARGFITVCRTIPDLVWALIFVIAVGLGPQAGVLAIMIDVIGLCGRFFADQIEEVDQEVLDALRMTGASEFAVLFCGVLPACLPSFVATSMFGLEQSTRSSVVLGLVGAGGIGVELNVSMALLRYDEAMAIILSIFVVVVIVERVSAAIRRRIMGEKR